MLATVFLYLKKSVLCSLIALLVLLFEIDARATWAVPTIISLIGFIFLAGGVYVSVRKDLASYRDLKAKVEKEMKENDLYRYRFGEVEKQVKELKNALEPPQPTHNLPKRRWSER